MKHRILDGSERTNREGSIRYCGQLEIRVNLNKQTLTMAAAVERVTESSDDEPRI